MLLDYFFKLSGILFTVSGALIEVIGLVGLGQKGVARQAQTYFGYNPNFYIGLVEQRIRAITGFICILIGFVFQLILLVVSEEILMSRYLPLWSALLIFAIVGLIVFIAMKIKIKVDINYFMIPNEIKNIENAIKIVDERGNSKEHVIIQATSLSKRLGLKIKLKSYEESQDEIKKIIQAGKKYCDKQKTFSLND